MPSLAGMQILSATTQAMYSVGSTDNGARGYVILARGRPNWFVGKLVGGGDYVNRAEKIDHVWRVGNLSYKVVYDPATNSALLLGNIVRLDTANVLFLDHIGDVSRSAELVGTACVHLFDVDNPYVELMKADSRIQSFVNSRQ
ncbi:MAG TPA: hypothetical protein VJS39_07370 [Gemmatimonadaceae bacterium]|nr:hypothetical protein [Gemmatimonadaceae bacterium]